MVPAAIRGGAAVALLVSCGAALCGGMPTESGDDGVKIKSYRKVCVGAGPALCKGDATSSWGGSDRSGSVAGSA